MNEGYHLRPVTDQELVTSDNKVAYISMCFLLTYYDFAMPYTVETMDLISSKEKKCHLWRDLFSIHDTRSLSFQLFTLI